MRNIFPWRNFDEQIFNWKTVLEEMIFQQVWTKFFWRNYGDFLLWIWFLDTTTSEKYIHIKNFRPKHILWEFLLENFSRKSFSNHEKLSTKFVWRHYGTFCLEIIFANTISSQKYFPIKKIVPKLFRKIFKVENCSRGKDFPAIKILD